jgi:hypothetical protein
MSDKRTVYHFIPAGLTAGAAERDAAVAAAKAEREAEIEELRVRLAAKSVNRRQRKPTLANALKQAKKAGLEPSGATVTADGNVSLTFGAGDGTQPNGNPWDEVLTNAANQKRPS